MAADSSLVAALARRNDKDFWSTGAGVSCLESGASEWQQIPPCSRRSLVGMTRVCGCGLCAGPRSIVTTSESQNPHSVAKCATKVGTLEFAFELLGTELRDGVKPFCGGDRLSKIGV